MKIKHLKSNKKQHQIKPILCDDEFKAYLKSLIEDLLLLQLIKLPLTVS